ncbi:MAG: DinB family protein [Chloroflexi bacterium]|uniref:DinB family protein n=1 Tax=Candidatus Chlorohelix allophototropha TaxID=3003348 RepID=A0A8T7M422_9CHLR|nr:DinB family protein [Chloroflexota bacterium]WJW70202.1 DinB family protein [Chloroflexota bacterium L227-S17]
MAIAREKLITQLEQTTSALVKLVSGLEDNALDFKPETDSWSIREILAHLVDDEMYVMRLRLVRIVREDLPNLVPHDEKKWYLHRNTSRDKLEELLEDFSIQRRASLGIIQMMRESDWIREGIQPEYGQFSAEKWLEKWAGHDVVHLKQINQNLAAFQK